MGKTLEELKPCCSAETNWRLAKRLSGSASVESLREWVESLKL